MDKATPSPASADSVMAKAMMLVGALDDSCEEATSLPFLEAVTALRAEVERLAAQAAPTEDAYQRGYLDGLAKGRKDVAQAPVVQAGDANAPAVRMLTEDEVAQATEDGERSFRRWTQGVRGQTLMPQDSPTFHYVMAGAAKALAAFRAAIIADLCGDVEPVAIYHGRCVIDCGEHGHLDMQLLKMIPAGTALCTASTVAALKAERDAALARVAVLEKDAARYRWLRNRIDPREISECFGFRGHNVDEKISLRTDSSIDAALTKGQLAPQPQQEQSN